MSVPTESSTALAAPPGDGHQSLDRLFPLLYQQLRIIAHRQLGRRPNGATLETSELVHEAYLKVAARSRVASPDQAHLLALASLAMRHVLVDRAKARGRLKRGGGREIGRAACREGREG